MDLSTGVSLGGVVVGLSIATWYTVRWWTNDRGKKGGWRRTLAPFIAFACYGMLAVLTAGGIVGIITDLTLWGANATGSMALVYGVGGTSPNVTRNHDLSLTAGGHAMVVILTVGIAAAFRFGKRFPKVDSGLGIVCGICLGLASSIAGFAAMVLGPVVSTGGDWIVGLL